MTFTPQGGAAVNTRADRLPIRVRRWPNLVRSSHSGSSGVGRWKWCQVPARFTVQRLMRPAHHRTCPCGGRRRSGPTWQTGGGSPHELPTYYPVVIGGGGDGFPVFKWAGNAANAFGSIVPHGCCRGHAQFCPCGRVDRRPFFGGSEHFQAFAACYPTWQATAELIVKNNPFPDPAGVNASFVVRFSGNLSATTPTLVGGAVAGGLGGVGVVNNPNNVPAAVALANQRDRPGENLWQ